MAHPLNPEFLTQEAVAEVSQAAEEAGFEAVAVTEHPMPNDAWLEAGGHNALDPFVALSFAAAATKRLRLLTNLTVVPYRNPFMLAKAAASLDRLSGGRLILGCGTGYLREEFDALGVDFDERNALFDEALDMLRRTWRGDSVSHQGIHFNAVGNTAHPAPAQSEIPIWIGGNSKLSRRRAAEKAQGWMPIPNPRALGDRRRTVHLDNLDDLREIKGYMTDHAASIGRTAPIDVFFPALAGGMLGVGEFALGEHHDYLGGLAEIGVNWAMAPVAGSDLASLLEAISRYGQDVIGEFD